MKSVVQINEQYYARKSNGKFEKKNWWLEKNWKLNKSAYIGMYILDLSKH